MSLDYPEYEKLKKKGKTILCFLWRIGDIGYYIGIFGVVITPLGIIRELIVNEKLRKVWHLALANMLILTCFFVVIHILSSTLKYCVLKKGGTWD